MVVIVHLHVVDYLVGISLFKMPQMTDSGI